MWKNARPCEWVISMARVVALVLRCVPGINPSHPSIVLSCGSCARFPLPGALPYGVTIFWATASRRRNTSGGMIWKMWTVSCAYPLRAETWNSTKWKRQRPAEAPAPTSVLASYSGCLDAETYSYPIGICDKVNGFPETFSLTQMHLDSTLAPFIFHAYPMDSHSPCDEVAL